MSPDAAAAPRLVASELSKGFAGVQALRAVQLQAYGGQVMALLGENGAGKSTLLKILAGAHRPDSGTLTIDGQRVSFSSPRDAHRAGVRVIYQEPEIIPHVSVAENVYVGALPARGHRFNRAALRARVAADRERYGFTSALDPDALGSELSPAQRQLVEIMRTMVSDAAVIAFDEPTSSLSDHEVNLLFGLIRRLRAEGRAIAYVSHRLAEVFEIADEVVILRDGKVVAQKSMSEVDRASLIRLMVGRDLSQVFDHESSRTDTVVLDVEHVTSRDVRDISLQVHAGEIVALAGLVGAGRSELAGAIVGDLPIISGSVAVDGRRIHLREPSSTIRAGVGYAALPR